MKFLRTPIIVLLALAGGCALAPPSASHSGNGGSENPATQSSTATGGNGGLSSSTGGTGSATSGGISAQGGRMTGGTSATGGNLGGATATGGSSSGGGTMTGGTSARGGASGGNATGGATTRGGSSVTGGNTTGGINSGAGTRTGGTTASGGTPASGGSSARGGTTATGGMGGSATGGTASSGNTHSQPPPITNGSSGFATRYWDCCKPSCGWSANANGKPAHTCGKDGTSQVGNDTQSALNGGGGYMCFWGAPWSVSDTLSYGFAAFNNVPCGTCFQIQFSGKGQYNGSDPGSMAIKDKTMIVQVINIGDMGSPNQFDLLMPGGGVGSNNACTGGAAQWSNIDIGATSGGMIASCARDKSCIQQKCQAAFGNMPQMLAGCNWVTSWFAAADNPQMVYQKIACPAEITAKSGM